MISSLADLNPYAPAAQYLPGRSSKRFIFAVLSTGPPEGAVKQFKSPYSSRWPESARGTPKPLESVPPVKLKTASSGAASLLNTATLDTTPPEELPTPFTPTTDDIVKSVVLSEVNKENFVIFGIYALLVFVNSYLI